MSWVLGGEVKRGTETESERKKSQEEEEENEESHGRQQQNKNERAQGQLGGAVVRFVGPGIGRPDCFRY